MATAKHVRRSQQQRDRVLGPPGDAKEPNGALAAAVSAEPQPKPEPKTPAEPYQPRRGHASPHEDCPGIVQSASVQRDSAGRRIRYLECSTCGKSVGREIS